MTIRMQEDADTGPSFFDDKVLDQWELPVGPWVDQAVDWIDQNLAPVLDVIRWPFAALFEYFVKGFLLEIPWVVVVVAFFIVGTVVRNLKVGVMVAIGLTCCGLLGSDYWDATMVSIGLILVAVFLCALIGIPIGVLCGRFDGVWQTIRPILDAMQVIHTFVYMLPVIFFFGFGAVPATMVTMIFALPPLIRLTNLGIRQVPEDVVEASRAFGAPEFKVLTDVQLPLARPAMMTGLNQTLLLSISMAGVAAIIGAGGLGQLVFRAVQNLDVGLAGSSGVAFFLVAVILDRISQPEASDGTNLFSRMKTAWSHRKDPEELLDAPGFSSNQSTIKRDRFAPVVGSERLPILISGMAGIAIAVSTFLVWSHDSGLISGYGRRTDADLAGESFNGIVGAGGSFFGIFVGLCGLFLAATMVNNLVNPGAGPAWMRADGALLAAGGALVTSIAFLLARPSTLNLEYSHGIGVFVAVAASVVAVLGAVLWVRVAPMAERVPQVGGISIGRALGGLAATACLVIGLYAGWSFDRRTDTVITPEIQAMLDDVYAKVDAGEMTNGVAGQEIQRINNLAVKAEIVVIDGQSDQGAGLGTVSLVFGLFALALLAPGAGMNRKTLSEAASRFRAAEVASGRETTVLIGVVSALFALLWLYPVDLRGPFVMNFQFGRTVESAIVVAALIGLVAVFATRSTIRQKALWAQIILVGGLAALAAMVVVAHGPIALACIAIALAIPVVAAMAFPELTSRQQWTWSAISAALGFGLMGIGSSWILSLMRVADSKFFSGVGSALVFVSGFLLFSASRKILSDFGRRKIYDDVTTTSSTADETKTIPAETSEFEPIGAGAAN